MLSQNPNGQGVRVVDQNTGREVINTNSRQAELEGDGGVDDRVVSGLLEWLENKKKKKKPEVVPIILPPPIQPPIQPFQPIQPYQPMIHPIPPPPPPPHHHHNHIQPKIIHIHINNHPQKHQKKHNHNKHGGYEDYHGGHYDHDKHYHGKHSWPLLSHHYNWDQDYYFGMSGGHGGGGGGHSAGDDYAGYESKQVASKVGAPSSSSKPKRKSGA